MSKATNPGTGTPEDWLRHSKSDLAVCNGVRNDPDVLPNQVAFHAQQAAEKALKGVMIQESITFPLTHDLQELVKRWTSAGRHWPPELAAIKTLNPYAVESRYPGYIHQLTNKEVDAAIEIASKVVTWADAIINPTPSKPATNS